MQFKGKKGALKIILVIIFALVALSIGLFLIGNVTVSYYDQVEYKENQMFICEANKLSDRQDVQFVFTKPFKSLENFENAEVVKRADISNGQSNISLLPGRYGLYAEFNDGSKKLYGDLILDNSTNNIPRSEQGPWYVLVGPLKNNFAFRTSNPC